MLKKTFRTFAAFLIIAAVLSSTFLTAFAGTETYVPFESYTYWNDITGAGRKIVYNRPMYDTKQVITAQSIGVDAFTEISDICTDGDGNMYILDSDSRIVVLSSDFRFLREITSVKGDENYTFVGARNVFVGEDGKIFISDTENNRVLVCDGTGNYIDEYLLPESPLIPENFVFRPVRTVADSKGYVYILSDGSYYGALLYAPDKSFIGFYGSNTVVNGVIGALKSLLERMFPNNSKKSSSERKLPFVFSDIVVDDRDFIYTATDSLSVAQIKKLSPGSGSNILDSEDVNFTDDEVNRTYNNGEIFKQTITGLEVDEDGMIYCLDSSYGRIYVYDPECRMVTAFGGGMGNGTQKGTFSNASAISSFGGNIFVSDKANNNVTVFSRNSYGDKVMSLIKMTNNGDYSESREGWEEVLKLDRNLQLAYVGLARAYLADGEYELAMDSALEGYDRETYSLAFEYYRNIWIADNFTWLFLVIIFAIAALIAAAVVISKKQIKIIRNQEISLLLKTSVHPGNVFSEIKDKQKGSVLLAVVMLLLFYVSTVSNTLFGGFMFTAYDPGSFNSLLLFVRSVGLVLLWIAANWLVCTLAGGKGKAKEIFIVTCYSLTPLIVRNIICTVFSNFLLPTEGSFLSILTAAAYIYAAIIFIIGMMRIHDFTMSRFIGTSILTVCGMAAIVFLIVLVGILLQQLGGFIATIFVELIM